MQGMQGWNWGSVPPVAIGQFSDDKVHQVSPVSTPVSTEGSDDGKLTAKDRRLALEYEVGKLRKKHSQEVNLHRALERALQRPVGVLPRIPSYLPAKVQKLLAEVAVLEEEVIRLEDHVVYLRQELSDEAAQCSTWGTQKQPNNFNAANNNNAHNVNELGRSNNLSKIRLKKEAAVKENPAKDAPKEPASKASSVRKTKATSDSKAKDHSPKLILPFKSNKDSPKKEKDAKDHHKDHKENHKEPVKEKGSTKESEIPRRLGGKTTAAAVSASPAPTVDAPPSRKPPVNEVLSRFQGLQQPWKPTGGTNAKNIFRQFNSLGWNDKHQPKQHSTSSPRHNGGSNNVSWLDRQQLAGVKEGSVASPRSYSRNGPSTGNSSSNRPGEKENLQSAAAQKIATRSPRASKLGLSMDFESSNVDRKSSLGTKALLAAVQPAAKVSTANTMKEAPTIEPNRLSEELVKCLVSIYNKLAKSNSPPGSKTTSGSKVSSQGSGSRINASAKAGDDKGQCLPDLYGVCKDAPRDIGPYRHIQEITVDTIDSSGIGNCTALYKKLGSMMEQLEKADVQALSHHEKLAFWINIYNVCMMHAFLERGLPSSPSKVVALMRKAVVNVGGYMLNALTIEHFILRLPCRPKNVRTSPWKHFQRTEAIPSMSFMKNSAMEEIIEKSAYGLDWHEPLVTFGLCCGSRSSPALRVYTASAVESELETAKREYLQAAVGVSAQEKVFLPKLLEWYMRDFAKDMEALLEWVCQQLSSPLRDAVQECVNHPKEGVLSQSIEVMAYDFNFRYLFLI